MASAQLRDVPAGLATPSRVEDNATADIPGGVNIQNTGSRTPAVAVGTRPTHGHSVVGSVDPPRNRHEAVASNDEASLVDHSEDETRRQWTEHLEGQGQSKTLSRKRKQTASSVQNSKKRRNNGYSSLSSESEDADSSDDDKSSNSSSGSESDKFSDTENFVPKPEKSKSQVKIPKHVTKYIVKYAIKGIDKKNRQEMTKSWPIPESKQLKGLEVDRFFKKNYFKGKRKWNAKLESCKVNNQLRILDAFGPLSVLWSEAERIKRL